MNEHALSCFLSGLKQYPIKLARRIGCQEAILWYDLFTTYGSLEFQFRPESTVLLGISEGKKIFDKLFDLGYITEGITGLNFKLSFNKIISDAGGFTNEDNPPFEDADFLYYAASYKVLLALNGRIKTNKQIFDLFRNKSLEESVRALKRSVDNKWITLKFDDNRFQKDSGGNSSRSGAGFAAGGGTNTAKTTDLKPEEI